MRKRFTIGLVLGALVLIYFASTAFIRPTNSDVTRNLPSATPSASPPPQLVRDFYSWYQNCITDPPKAVAGQVSVYCQTSSPFVSDNIAANLARGGVAKAGADPVFCAQNPPTEIAIDDIPLTDPNHAIANIQTRIGQLTPIKIAVALISDQGSWQVDNITCRTPQL